MKVECPNCGKLVKERDLRRDWEKECWFCVKCEEDYIDEQLKEIDEELLEDRI